MSKNISRRDFLKGSAAAALGVAAARFLAGCASETSSSEIENSINTENELNPTETKDCDLVIVGAGACGLTAALKASELGLHVVVLEKGMSLASCNASMAGGPSMAETCIQESENETVTTETLFKYMYDFSNCTVNGNLLRNVIGRSGATVNSMVDAGVEMYLRPDVYGAGFRARHGFNLSGADRFEPIKQAVEARGGEFCFFTSGEKLVMTDGKVSGVIAKNSDTKVVSQINAKAVLIATGGYLGNAEMMKEHFGNVKINPLGNQLSDGTGINMVLDAGGILDRNWAICGNEFAGSNQKAGGWWFNFNQNFKYPIFGGLLVNRNGDRFMDEGIFATKALSLGGEASLREGLFYSVIDEKYLQACATEGIWKFLGEPEEEWYVGKMSLSETILDSAPDTVQEAIDQGWGYKADTIEELAEHFGLSNLAKTVEQYNGYCANKADEQFYKNPVFLTPVSEGPFYVFEYEPSAWCTFGGVKVDNCLRALNADQQPIEGLYVGGVDAGSMYTSPYYINEGATLGLSFSSGTYAAEVIKKYIDAQ